MSSIGSPETLQTLSLLTYGTTNKKCGPRFLGARIRFFTLTRSIFSAPLVHLPRFLLFTLEESGPESESYSNS
jgi:hypothetical protein